MWEEGSEIWKWAEVREKLEDYETAENKATEIAVHVTEKDLEVGL